MSKLKTFNAALMVSGTSVGTGILGLPIATSSAGFIPSLGAFLFAWIFMTLAALHILEIKMEVRGSHNLSSMIKLTLGKYGQLFASIVIPILLYSLLCTYMMAGSSWLRVLIDKYIHMSSAGVILCFTTIFAMILYLGERFIYNINNFLSLCLIAAFIVTIGVSITPQNYDFIQHMNVDKIFASLPILLTTFGFSIIIPSVVEYVDYDKKSATTAIVWGGILALLAYILWEWVTLGNIPIFEEGGLLDIAKKGDDGTGVILAFSEATKNPLIDFTGRVFAIFAAITSFMGVSVALLHALSGGLKIKHASHYKIYLLLILYIPPILVTYFVPNVFVEVLSFAGLFVAIILGLFPVAMVYKTRNKNCKLSFKKHIQKNIFLLVSALFFILVIIQEIRNLFA